MDEHYKFSSFIYEEAFSRNIGFITENELQILRSKRIAIAGLGGVGGIYLLTLARLGIANFNISDYDEFELVNFNRQYGATLDSIGKQKADTLADMCKQINPETNLRIFNKGIDQYNTDEFLKNVDIYVDGLDFFELDARILIFKRCYELNIPAIIAAPLGMGVSCLTFMPGKMNFSDYFGLEDYNYQDQLILFLLGLNPTLSNRRYIVKKNTVDFSKKKAPSTVMACNLCAGVIGVEALKILLGRGKIICVPNFYLFDPYLNLYKKGWVPFGYKNPLQKMRFYFLRYLLSKYHKDK